jgi:transcriptional regulator with PAS, ATPase and Fis domain
VICGQDWIEELPVAITVSDATGSIIAMNARARETFASKGGAALIGKSLFDCHPEPARSRLRELFAAPRANHYTITKRGQKKIIHQLPWHADGVFAGYVEISVPLGESLPHFDRG